MRPQSVAMRYRVPADLYSTAFSSESSEPALVLTVFNPENGENDYTVVDLLPTIVHSKNIPEAPFEMACLGNALKYGY